MFPTLLRWDGTRGRHLHYQRHNWELFLFGIFGFFFALSIAKLEVFFGEFVFALPGHNWECFLFGIFWLLYQLHNWRCFLGSLYLHYQGIIGGRFFLGFFICIHDGTFLYKLFHIAIPNGRTWKRWKTSTR